MSSQGSRKGLSRTFRKLKKSWEKGRAVQAVKREAAAKRAVRSAAKQQRQARYEAALGREDVKKWIAILGPQNPAMRRLAVRTVCVVAVASLVANVVMYNRWSSNRPLVRVGPRVVTRGEYLGYLDQSAGKSVLNQVVLGEIIRQAAAAAHVPASDADIDNRLASIRRTRPQSIPPQDTPALREQVGLTLALENLRIQHVNASDAEMADYYAAHKGEFALPTQMHNTVVLTGKPADAALAAKLLHQGAKPQMIASHPGLHVVGVNGFAFNMNALPPALAQPITQRLMAMKTGDVQTFPVSKIFITFGVQERDDAVLPTLAQVHEQVARAVKMAKAPSEQAELQTLYQANKPSFDMANYAGYFREFDVSGAPAPGKRTASAR